MDYQLEKIDDYRYLLPKTGGMRVPGLIYSSAELLPKITSDKSPEQVANVAQLPGIINYSLAMPDIHWGYGAPIGGVAAFDLKEGVVAPGVVGYDINCGVRLLRTGLQREEVSGHLKALIDGLYKAIPCGVGESGRLKLSSGELVDALEKGAAWAVKKGYGPESDLNLIEENGAYRLADSEKLSGRALERGLDQLGTLGSGNHFLEIQVVQEIFDREAAAVFGLFPGQVTVMIHTGSRGLGYQVADDYLRFFHKVTGKYQIAVSDRQLVCAPYDSPEGKAYLAAMAAAANFAWANRQIIAYWVSEVFQKVLERGGRGIGLSLLYDVAHNIAKLEEHSVNGRPTTVLVHRKGATRSFPAGSPAVPDVYRKIGQPVLIPGTMGTASYVLVGTQRAMAETWGSTCHGAGRNLSRHEAVKRMKGRSPLAELAAAGVIAKAPFQGGLAEEMPEAYKDVDSVVEIVEKSGLSRKVARLIPLAVIKG